MNVFKTEIVVYDHDLVVEVTSLRPMGDGLNLLQPKSSNFIFNLKIHIKSNNETFLARVWAKTLLSESYLDKWSSEILKEINPMLTSIMIPMLKNYFQYQLFDRVCEKNKGGEKLTVKAIKNIADRIVDEIIQEFGLDENVFKKVYKPFSVVAIRPLLKSYAIDYEY
ncbi:hypothetical protein CSB11_01850 [Candidatus Campbellbacteria bacterium]|nr:MAG: hypothetical protein CSB11_01850 [Candidatus Campbellbacteria bacterium]